MIKAIVFNDEYKHIENCLASIKDLPGETIVFDISQKLKIKEKTIHVSGNLSDIKNKIFEKYKSVFFIDPYEEYITGNIEDGNYKVNILSDNWLSSDNRIFISSPNFKNPIYEYSDTECQDSDIYIRSNGFRSKSFIERNINDWKNKLQNSNIIRYYESLFYLSQGNIKKFKSTAKECLFFGLEDTNRKLLEMYIALVSKKENDFLSWTSKVLIERPWCAEIHFCLAEYFFSIGQIGRSIAFYQNCINLGKYRPISDNLPIDVSKYLEEPNNILNYLKNTK